MTAKTRKLDCRSPQTPEPERLRAWDLPTVFVWAICAYVLILPVAGMILTWGFSLPRGQEVTQDRIRFMVVNAVTLTGFQGNIDTGNMPLPCSIALFVLTMLGTGFVLTLGGLAAVRILDLPVPDGRVLRGSLVVTIGLTLLCSLPLIDSRTDPLQSWMLTLSALGNSGLHLGGLPGVSSWKTRMILLPLVVFGGLGLPVLMELPGVLFRKQAMSSHARRVLVSTSVVYLISLCAITAMRLWAGAAFGPTIVSASTIAINSRSAGFPWEYAQTFPRLVQWLVMLLMLAGAGPAGTAGGIGLTTIDQLGRGVRASLKGGNPGRTFGLAAAWSGIYLLTVAVFFSVLLCTNADVRADVLLFETISAVGNVGLSFDRVILVSPGLDVLTAAMLAGRLLPLAMLWWLAARREKMTVLIG
ncbi:MAG: hypothetical protein ABSH20_22460 [Tepidisphaeraceae bacterium]